MKKFIDKIRYLGVKDGQPHTEKRSIILLNEIIILLLAIQCLIYPEFIFKLDFLPLLIGFTVQFVTAIPLILAYYGKTNTAKWFFNIVFTIFMTLIIMTHGQELRADYCYLVFVVTAVIFFKKKLHRLALISLIVICYLLSIYYTNNYKPIFIDFVSDWNSILVFSAMVFSITLTISRFVAENETYEDELYKTLDTLKQKQSKIELQNDSLEKVNKDLERFAYISSHNLKTPIRTIRSFTDLISRDLKRGKQENLNEYLDFIKQGTAQMQLLITDILEYSRFNQQNNFETSPVDLNNTINFIHSQLQSFTDKQISLEATSLPIIETNRTFINAIFQNLIENGVKYNDSDTIRIRIDYKDFGDKHRFCFNDNGIGIDEKYHDKIFEMFERLQSDTKYKGSGVGLGMSKKIIEKLNGKIWVKSTINQGSTFFVELPKQYSKVLATTESE